MSIASGQFKSNKSNIPMHELFSIQQTALLVSEQILRYKMDIISVLKHYALQILPENFYNILVPLKFT